MPSDDVGALHVAVHDFPLVAVRHSLAQVSPQHPHRAPVGPVLEDDGLEVGGGRLHHQDVLAQVLDASVDVLAGEGFQAALVLKKVFFS